MTRIPSISPSGYRTPAVYPAYATLYDCGNGATGHKHQDALAMHAPELITLLDTECKGQSFRSEIASRGWEFMFRAQDDITHCCTIVECRISVRLWETERHLNENVLIIGRLLAAPLQLGWKINAENYDRIVRFDHAFMPLAFQPKGIDYTVYDPRPETILASISVIEAALESLAGFLPQVAELYADAIAHFDLCDMRRTPAIAFALGGFETSINQRLEPFRQKLQHLAMPKLALVPFDAAAHYPR